MFLLEDFKKFTSITTNMEVKKSDVDNYLDKTQSSNVPDSVPPPDLTKVGSREVIINYRKKKSKIELAGKQVMEHLMELAKNTDLSYAAMSSRINELYSLKVTKNDVFYFFRKNKDIIDKLAEEQKSLNEVRANLYLEHNGVLVKDIKILDGEVERLLEEDMIEPDKRAKAIGDLLDKKGRLLLRHSRLSGKLDVVPKTKIEKMQVNVFQQINEEKSDIIRRLKKADFGENIIDVKPNENKQTD